MAEIIRMPRMSDTMTEGNIVAWHKKVGDTVKAGDVLAEVETDKATMELESYHNGVLLHIGVPAGQAVKVEGVIAILGKAGEDISALLTADSAAPASTATTPPPAAPTAAEPVAAPLAATPAPAQETSDGRLLASPLAKKIAADKGIDLRQVRGSGDEGRIVKRDVETFVPAAAPAKSSEAAAAPTYVIPAYKGEEEFTEVATSQMRKVIARRLAESMYSAPHFYLTTEINMDKAVAARERLNEFSPVKISYNDIVVKAVAIALRQHPAINAAWLDDRIRYNKHIHIGMAVAVEDGLLVPVIRFADQKSLSHLAAEAKQMATKARERKLAPQEMEGSTFSISNLGMMDIDEFTAIINPPNSCILAVGSIREMPRVINGTIQVAHVMKMTLSCDHRVVDGMTGAKYLKTLKDLLEEPMRLLV